MEHPPESPRLASGHTVAPDVRPDARFCTWEAVPGTTKLSALCATSLLVLTSDPTRDVLVRCSPGVDEGTVTLVHSSTARPNALRMLVVDADSEIGAEAQRLSPGGAATVVAVPHITWMHRGGGMPWRAPLTVLGALAAAVPVMMLAPPIGVVAALPVAGVVGVILWFLLRTTVPTRMGSRSGLDEAVTYARSCIGTGSLPSPLSPPSAILQETPAFR